MPQRLSVLLGHTLREAPADAEVRSHQLLLRGRFIEPLAAGIFSYLPLGLRALRNIEAILRDEMNAIGGQEISMPVVHPASLWQRTGRWYAIDAELARFKDRGDRDMVLAMTHEEVVSAMAVSEITSYRDVPKLVYQIQTKFRDDPRPRAGLIRGREFTMKDSYSFDAGVEGLQVQYAAHHDAYLRIFARCGLDAILSVDSDSGMMGGNAAREYMFLSPIGEDTLCICDACGHAANRQVATTGITADDPSPQLEMSDVATPDARTIADLCAFLGIEPQQTAKAVMLMAPDSAEAPGKLVLALVRGDAEVSQTKLTNAVAAGTLRPAQDDEIRSRGVVPGFASPIGADRQRTIVVVDAVLATTSNVVSGANREDTHLRNVNVGRDFTADITADIAEATAGDPCPNCQAPLRLERGVEVGNIFQLGTKYSEAFDASFTDAQGVRAPLVMGSYGIGVTRLLACIAEAHNDERGLCWPASIAPYPVHVVRIRGSAGAAVDAMAETLIAELEAAGLPCLDDDRDVSPGVKFADADLLGMPVRVAVSARHIEAGEVEVKPRRGDARTVAAGSALATIQGILTGA